MARSCLGGLLMPSPPTRRLAFGLDLGPSGTYSCVLHLTPLSAEAFGCVIGASLGAGLPLPLTPGLSLLSFCRLAFGLCVLVFLRALLVFLRALLVFLRALLVFLRVLLVFLRALLVFLRVLLVFLRALLVFLRVLCLS